MRLHSGETVLLPYVSLKSRSHLKKGEGVRAIHSEGNPGCEQSEHVF